MGTGASELAGRVQEWRGRPRAWLREALDNPVTHGRARRRDGHVVDLGRASIAFYSAEPGAHVVGGTASLLLECDEAQDVLPDKWEKDFRPMGATADVVGVLYGTPWTVPHWAGRW